eukprot:m.177392 g.177392  ORF g.177392 m.177392 type:complete len:67 (+) comp14909_c0_seq1:1402-1602(+)
MNGRLVSLLDHLHEYVPSATVFLASMIGFPSQASCADGWNQGLSSYVQQYRSKGMKIVYTPMQECL